MNSQELDSRLALARSAAREAGQLTLRYFQRDDLQVDLKLDSSPVTVADREAEEYLRKAIGEQFPLDAILGEEFGEKSGSSGYRWILDPIDGTKSFIRGVPLFGTMVGVERGEQSVIGVVYIPALEECIHAATGQGAWYQRRSDDLKRARVSSRAKLSESLLSSSDTRSTSAARLEAYQRLQKASLISRTWGDCYGYLLVATGRAEVMIDPVMNVWDAAAIQPIVVEAGGTFTDWNGLSTIYGGEGLATNGLVLEEVLAITRGA